MKEDLKGSANIYQEYWDIVDKSLNEGSDAGYKMAIIETEKILTLAFKEKKIPGDSNLEKINNFLEFIKNPEKLKYSHAMYERIINEPGFRISSEDTKEIVLGYYKAINDITNIKSKNISIGKKVDYFFKNNFKKYSFKPKMIFIYLFIFFLLIFISTETSLGIEIAGSFVAFTRFLFYTVIFGLLKVSIIFILVIGALYYLQHKLKK
ncbi:hypothetical protein K0B03_02200 [Patescibacteria group bacterium]|nr:hypothetical protein [Patescibacteria group bacterium]